VNSYLLSRTALSMDAAVVLVLCMTVRTPVRGISGAACRGLGTEMPSVASIRVSYASFGKHKSQVSTIIHHPFPNINDPNRIRGSAGYDKTTEP
jgi:hypothetical protein